MPAYTRSKELFTRAQKFIPGGVNSPVRAFSSVGGTPLFIESAKGAILRDADGNEYVDYVGSWGPMLLGHAWPPVIEAVQRAASQSTSFGAPTEVEIELAETVQRMVPGVESVRMVNSGTEACMSAIRVARGYTGKDKIIKFEGCYHGHGDSFLIKAGSGALTLGQPNSPGVTEGTARDTLLARYNDLASVDALLEEHSSELAALIIEPVPGNMGCILPEEGFLEGLRERCNQHGIVLIFDEVMTGFRLARGGAQELYGVTADLVCLGKIIGAGLPVGAFGGKKEIMDVVAPVGPVYQAGTLSGNPLAMHAGLALLTELNNHPEHYQTVKDFGQQLEVGLRSILTDTDLPYQINWLGSMVSLHFTNEEVKDFESAQTTDKELFAKFFHGMLERGIYFPPSPFESCFLSTALTPAHMEKTLNAAKEVLQNLPIPENA